MDQKVYSFKVTETQEKFIEEEAKRINESTSVVLREIVEKGMNKKELLEEIESVKKLTIERQGLFQTQIEYLTSNVTSLRFEVKSLYAVKFGEERAHKLRLKADELGAKKLLEIKTK